MADTPAFETIGSLAAQIRQGAVSPVALTEALLARIDALDPHLHAFLTPARERALGQASPEIQVSLGLVEGLNNETALSSPEATATGTTGTATSRSWSRPAIR